jgi:hypothetical protein
VEEGLMNETKTTELRARDDANERMDDDGGGQRLHAHPDARRSHLRGIMARFERSMPAVIPLQAAWRDLVDALALGPEPAVRNCPRCGELVMLAATRCGHCWTPLAVA